MNATLLIVTRKIQGRFECGPNEALMIIGRRIDQMPKHLFAPPGKTGSPVSLPVNLRNRRSA
jgi:hypothetical protein